MMTIEEVEKIEQMLDIKLPEELRQKYLSPELDELDAIETLGLEDYLNKPSELKNYLIRDSNKLIKLNLRLRKNGLFKKPFHPSHFAIGYTRKTNYYFIDLRDPKVIVYSAMNNKSWAYSVDNLAHNILMSPNLGFDDFLELYPLSSLKIAQRAKARKEAGIPERQPNTDEVYAFLQGIQDRIPKENIISVKPNEKKE